MKFTIYQVDAFAEKVFEGNPAAVCPLNEWIEDELLLKIASENNLSDTAFYVVKDERIEIRWFTPNTEVNLCGHATLATAYVLVNQENFKGDIIPFYSVKSGNLPVFVNEDTFTLDFPIDVVEEITLSDELINTTNIKPNLAFKGKSDLVRGAYTNSKNEDVYIFKNHKPLAKQIYDLYDQKIVRHAKNLKDFVPYQYYASTFYKGAN